MRTRPVWVRRARHPSTMSEPNLSSFIWSVADLLRGGYKQSENGKGTITVERPERDAQGKVVVRCCARTWSDWCRRGGLGHASERSTLAVPQAALPVALARGACCRP